MSENFLHRCSIYDAYLQRVKEIALKPDSKVEFICGLRRFRGKSFMGMRKTYKYRLELNGKTVEQGCTATMEAIRSAAQYNATVLHQHEIKVYAGDDHLEYMGTCQPDGTFTDSFGKSRKIDEDGKWL